MSSHRAHPGRNGCLNDLIQLKRRLDRLFHPRLHDMLCDVSGKLIFAVIPDNPVQRLLIVIIHDIPRRQSLTLVHAHIKRRVILVGKSPFRRVELI